jgi:hypothetical protein
MAYTDIDKSDDYFNTVFILVIALLNLLQV